MFQPKPERHTPRTQKRKKTYSLLFDHQECRKSSSVSSPGSFKQFDRVWLVHGLASHETIEEFKLSIEHLRSGMGNGAQRLGRCHKRRHGRFRYYVGHKRSRFQGFKAHRERVANSKACRGRIDYDLELREMQRGRSNLNSTSKRHAS